MTKVLDFVLLLRPLPNGYYCFPTLLLIATECVLKFTKYPEKKENYENEITKYQNILCATIVLSSLAQHSIKDNVNVLYCAVSFVVY